MLKRTYAIDFRREDVEYIMKRWDAGLCLSLVGVGSVGKSNLLLHLSDPDVQRHYRGQESPLFTPIVIDANALVPLSLEADDAMRCWAGYELLMHRIYMSLYPFEILGEEEAQRFFELYQMLQDGSNALHQVMALRYFELAISLFARHGVRFVFLFDEFEILLEQLGSKFFQTLRSIRDTYKNTLLFVTFSRAPLPVLVERFGIASHAVESFVELFSDSIYYVSGYNERDARQMLANLSARYGRQITEDVSAKLQQITGRYAGLLRAAFSVFDSPPPIDWQTSIDNLSEQFIYRFPVRSECQTIWLSLTPSEQYVLRAVARLVPYQSTSETEQTVAMLIQKRLLLLEKSPQKLTIHPPLFRVYVSGNPS